MASQAFDDSNWSNYFEITSDNTLVDNANDNLVYSTDVHSAPPSGFWTTVQSDGSDVRVVNSAGDTAYSFEIEEIDTTNENFTVFWDSQNLATGSDTTWRIYYGNSGASAPADGDTLGTHNVWNANYEAVYHLNESSGSTAFDSTSNNNDGTYQGNVPTQVTGVLGKAQDFDGTDDLVEIPDTAALDLNTSQFTMTAWINLDGTSETTIFGKWASGDSNQSWLWQAGVQFVAQAGSQTASTPDTAATTNEEFRGARHDNGTVTHFLDGSTDGSDGSQSQPQDTNTTVRIAQQGSTENEADGIIDEARIVTTALSNNWISTEYNNQSNAGFWTVGAEQSVGGRRRMPVMSMMGM